MNILEEENTILVTHLKEEQKDSKAAEKKVKELEDKYNKLLASGSKKGTEDAVQQQLTELEN